MAQTLGTNTFDYSCIDAATALFVRQQTGEIRTLMRRTAQYIIEIGQKLCLIKEKLGHGHFRKWLETEFEWTDETARRFMNVAQRFKEKPQIVAFAPSALYLLAAPSVPEAARIEAINRAQAGENISHKVAQQIKQKYLQVLEPDQSPPSSQAATLSLSAPEMHPKFVAPSSFPRQAQIDPLVNPVGQPISPVISAQTSEPALAVATAPLVAEQLGHWWQLGRHLLYCGDPQSTAFRNHLPEQVALSLAFPPSQDWRPNLPCKANAVLSLFSSYVDQDLKTFRELVRQALLLYTESEDTVVFDYLPDPGILLLADQLECTCQIAEPNLKRCQTLIAAWTAIGHPIIQLNPGKLV